MTPDRTRDPAGEGNNPRNAEDGIDEAAGGADSSPYETEPSGEKTAKAEAEKAGGVNQSP